MYIAMYMLAKKAKHTQSRVSSLTKRESVSIDLHARTEHTHDNLAIAIIWHNPTTYNICAK